MTTAHVFDADTLTLTTTVDLPDGREFASRVRWATLAAC